MINSAAFLSALQLLTAHGAADSSADAVEGAAGASSDDLSERGSAPPPARLPDNDADARRDVRWLERWAPERNMGGIGVYSGAFIPGDRTVELEPNEDGTREFRSLDTVAATIGGRFFYYPSRFVGIEAEGAATPSRMSSGDRFTNWTARGSVVGQVGLWSVTPFILAGAGALSGQQGTTSPSVGPTVHVGGGVKLFATRYTQVRVDLRDVMSADGGVIQGENHSFEATLGMSVTLGRNKGSAGRRAASDDRDDDGVLDHLDTCANTWGVLPNGCPISRGDRDGDRVLDSFDACIDVAGDGDDGCPQPTSAKDMDSDGIIDADDACIDQPETHNDYKDLDGCPDSLPAHESLDGIVGGIYFDLGKPRLTPESVTTLDEIVAIFKANPDLQIKIIGHADTIGRRKFNLDLSERRAEAVRTYLEDRGIDPARLTTEGRGSDYPAGTNETEEGRAANRRIEFIISD